MKHSKMLTRQLRALKGLGSSKDEEQIFLFFFHACWKNKPQE